MTTSSSSAARAVWCVVALVVASITPGVAPGDARTSDLTLRLGGKAPPPKARERRVRAAPPRTEQAALAPATVRRGFTFRGARGDRTGG